MATKIKTRLSQLKTGDMFSFDSRGRFYAYYDHTGHDYFAFVLARHYKQFESGNVLVRKITKSVNDCEVFQFK